MIKDIYVGRWTTRKSEQLRQVDAAISALQEAAPNHRISRKYNRDHELAHIAAQRPGVEAKMRAAIVMDKNHNVETWRLIHQQHPFERPTGGEIIRTSIAPLLVRKKSHRTLPSDRDMLNVLGGALVTILDLVQKKSRR